MASRRVKSAVIGVLAVVALSACGGSDSSGSNQSTLTGAWLTDFSTGGGSGVMGMLLTQSGSAVTGSLAWVGQLTGSCTNGQLSASTSFDGQVVTIAGSLSADGNQLTSAISFGNGNGASAVFRRVSASPANPDPSTPLVLTTTPANGAVGVGRSGLVVAVKWSKPVQGWDMQLTKVSSGTRYTPQELTDKSSFTWDSSTNTFGFTILPTLDSNSAYTLKLESVCSSGCGSGLSAVDWHDPFGTPAWTTPEDAFEFTFTTGTGL